MTSSPSVFVVDDDSAVTQGIAAAFDGLYRLREFASAEPAIEAVKRESPDLVLLDLGLRGMTGLDALHRMKALVRSLLVIVITGHSDIAHVIAAMKAGAHDYILKPLHMESLERTMRSALESIGPVQDAPAIQLRSAPESLPCFIGASPSIRAIMEFVDAIAKSPDTPVLLLGPTGSGKELIASAIHEGSPNAQGPLVSVNCAAIPTELVESELFGYDRGAFSGASSTGKQGLVEQAAGGTLFLDEVADLSLGAQAKLLRFLEEGEFFRLGGTRALRVRTRVVSATNKPLATMIDRGLFREDLYYRLSVTQVAVPPLNARKEDILPLARHFLLKFAQKFAKPFADIAPDAAAALATHDWKGNIRELRNAIEGAVLAGTGPLLTVSDLRTLRSDGGAGSDQLTGQLSYPPLTPSGIDLRALQISLERHFIEEALRLSDGNESRAAALLHLNHHTFRYQRRKLLG